MPDGVRKADLRDHVNVKLGVPVMHGDAVRTISRAFPTIPGTIYIGGKDPAMYGMCSATESVATWHCNPLKGNGMAHGEIKINASTDFYIPVVVVPFYSTLKELHSLSEKVQEFGIFRARHLSTPEVARFFVAVIRDANADPLKPARYGATVIDY